MDTTESGHLGPPWGKPRQWLRWLATLFSGQDAGHRLPSELAHLDARLLRDIGLDPVAARRELPLESLMAIERWYCLRGIESWSEPRRWSGRAAEVGPRQPGSVAAPTTRMRSS